MSKQAKLVVYSSDDEILVCALKQEPKLLREYFHNSSGRDLEAYDRDEPEDAVVKIFSRLRYA